MYVRIILLTKIPFEDLAFIQYFLPACFFSSEISSEILMIKFHSCWFLFLLWFCYKILNEILFYLDCFYGSYFRIVVVFFFLFFNFFVNYLRPLRFSYVWILFNKLTAKYTFTQSTQLQVCVCLCCWGWLTYIDRWKSLLPHTVTCATARGLGLQSVHYFFCTYIKTFILCNSLWMMHDLCGGSLSCHENYMEI